MKDVKKILLVEDNDRYMSMAVRVLREIPDVQIFTAVSKTEAYGIAMENEIDVFIVDIILNTEDRNDLSGINFVQNIRKVEQYKFTPVIMTTGLEDLKLHAYSYLHCYRYFEKPYDLIEMKDTVVDALKYTKQKKEKEFIYYKKGGILYFIKTSKIMYIITKVSGTQVVCVDEEVTLPYKTNNALLEELGSSKFIQCNKNTIVNKDYIASIDAANRYIKIINSGKTIEIGTRMKKRFMDEVLNR